MMSESAPETNSNTDGKVIANSTMEFNSTKIDFNNDTLMFSADADSLIVNGDFIKEIVIIKASGKSAGFLSCTHTTGAYFQDVVIEGENIYINGIFQYVNPMEFIGHLNVEGTFQNLNNGHRTATITGDLTNNGSINDNNYNNYLYITGNIEQNGTWSNDHNYLSGSNTQSISQTSSFTCDRITDTDASSSVQALTDLSFQDTDIDLGGSALLMPDGKTLTIDDGWLKNTDIISNKFNLSMNGSGFLQDVFADNAKIYNWVKVKNGCVFSDYTTVEGTLSNAGGGHFTLTIDGDIKNNGTIQDNSYNLYMNIDGDVFNNGSWINEWTQLNGYNGTVDQTITIQNENDITGQIRLFSTSGASSFDWYWNNNLLNPHTDFSGETAQVLNFLVPVSEAMAGVYNCFTDLGWSRNILIQSSTVVIADIGVKAILEGPFNGTDMNTSINTYLPLEQPFSSFPWGYPGSETVASIPNSDVVDWVLFELRDAPDVESAYEGTSIAKQAGFILNDGSIVGLDGFSNILSDIEYFHNLYVVLYQRNHLPVVSANTLTEAGGFYDYDFTTDISQAFGDNQKLINGHATLFAADMNADGSINITDLTDKWNGNTGETGYFVGDANMDGEVDNKDKNDLWYPNQGETLVLPE